ncbi:hypothetical protein [Loktanella sp. Alg231-35]|uniref:hypothetical protein n=1 Tax=Loktanella sp. Alg231-35 TaxID=1922220 RepID=UPI00131F4762|nr:hypothetical protein [Loktanella sp. Alg231-35]
MIFGAIDALIQINEIHAKTLHQAAVKGGNLKRLVGRRSALYKVENDQEIARWGGFLV